MLAKLERIKHKIFRSLFSQRKKSGVEKETRGNLQEILCYRYIFTGSSNTVFIKRRSDIAFLIFIDIWSK